MSEPYYDRALQLANQIYHRCDRSTGIPILWSANDNGFSDPCDALHRLEVMEPHVTRPGEEWQPGQPFFEVNVLAYRFREAWEPGSSLSMVRHPGEPSYKDLLRALCNHAWFEGLALRDLKIDIGVGQVETEFIVELLEKQLGSWVPETGFVVGPDSSVWQVISNDYWASRMKCATELGSERALFPDIES
jgi:hypothetical protein